MAEFIVVPVSLIRKFDRMDAEFFTGKLVENAKGRLAEARRRAKRSIELAKEELAVEQAREKELRAAGLKRPRRKRGKS